MCSLLPALPKSFPLGIRYGIKIFSGEDEDEV